MAEKNQPYTVTYSEQAKGWPSFYSYLPDYMTGMNGFFYTWNGGNLYRHNTNSLRNNYYDVQYNSTITSVFNTQPMTIKLFKTMSYESDDRWECTSLFSDLGTGSMLSTYFQQKEGEWFTFLRENDGNINFKQRSANGIGNAVTVIGPTDAVVVTFSVNIDSIISVGDRIYWQSTTAPTPTVEFAGVVTNVVNQSTTSVAGVVTPSSITIDTIGPYPAVNPDTTIPFPGLVPSASDFIFFIKNAVAESHGARGYYLNFTLKNTNTAAVELFAVGGSVMQSFP